MAEKFGYDIVSQREVFNAVGNRLRVKGRFEKAISVLQYNVNQYPDWAGGYDKLALALEEAGQLEKAAVQYQKAFEKALGNLDPNAELFKRHWDAVQKRFKNKR
ncbi:hypothetical protein HUU42_04720 [bacterium]|nr:hypothetical protein [bacterium]